MLKVAGLKQRWIIGPWLNIPHQCRTLVTILAQAEVSENGTSPVLSSTFIAFSLSLIPANGPVNFLSDPYGSTGTVNGFPSKPLLPSTNFATAGLLPLGPASVFPNPFVKTPYTYQWNLTLQQAIGSSVALEVGYLGSISRKWPTIRERAWWSQKHSSLMLSSGNDRSTV